MDKKRSFLVLCLTASLLVLYSPAVQAQSRPNIILFLADDISWDDIGCYGNTVVKTPHIDRLAEKGLKFENVYLTTSSCSPSRSSIISGRYPHNTGAPELHDPLPATQVMFPQLLKASGYYTALSGKNHMGPHIRKAFDLVSAGRGPGGEEDWMELLIGRPRDKPFFFWLASHDAHRDWQSDDKGVYYDPDSIEVPPMLYDGPVTRKELAAYYHEISRADYYLGQLVQELERQGILENTYIIFMSDNGRPFPRSKARLYDSGIKTPFIVYGPGVKAGVNKALFSSIDLAPSLLDLAAVAVDKRIQGRSLFPVLQGRQDGIRDFVFAEHNWHVFQAHERMVRYGDWVYIRNGFPERRNLAGESSRQFPAGKELWEAYEKGLIDAFQGDVFIVPRPSEELYNVAADPHQFRNLALETGCQDMRKYLSRVLDQWVKATGDSKPENPTGDRDDLDAKPLPGAWRKGEKPGAKNKAEGINLPGPVLKSDL